MGIIVRLFLIFLVSCGTKHKPAPSTPSDISQLETKMNTYLSLGSEIQDSDGFIDYEHCDSLLFSGLYGVASGNVNIVAARDENNKWHRRSLQHPECYPTHSKSTISRDMFIGLMWYIWEYKRLDLAEELYQYGSDNNWIMGEGDFTRTWINPSFRATLAELVYRLGGSDHIVARKLPQGYGLNGGFEAHLDILHVLLRAELMGYIETLTVTAGKQPLEVIKYQYQRSPKNALFSYAYHKYTDGDQTETINVLLDNKLFPSDRLPTSEDRCEPWLWQRDNDEDWQPCDKNMKHSGGDFLFVAALLLR